MSQSITVTAKKSQATADLSVSLSCPTSVKVDTAILCTVLVKNLGPATATNVQVTIALPPGFTGLVPNSGGKTFGSVALWTEESLASGASATLTVTATPSHAGVNLIAAAAWSQTPDVDPWNNLAFEVENVTSK